jgi:oligopeptide/dipeptide ABC transporter ATP-binding protein
MSEDVLRVEDLSVHFASKRAAVRAVDHVSLRIRPGEIVGLVGESASGKTTLGKALLRLVPGSGQITGGRVLFEGRDLVGLGREEMRQIRGRGIAMIVQDALAVMNPVTRVGEQIGEVVRDHVGGSRAEIRKRTIDIMRQVGLPEPERTIERYAHELSGGMQQRVAIAQALILEPKVIIADEPTTALDVTVQAQILELLRGVRERFGTSVMLITHDLAVVAELCDRALVMYAGTIVESGPVKELFREPLHPYTKALLSGLLPLKGKPPERLRALPGQPPRPEEWPSGCRFHPRCPLREALGTPARCVEEAPVPDAGEARWAACHFVAEGRARQSEIVRSADVGG